MTLPESGTGSMSFMPETPTGRSERLTTNVPYGFLNDPNDNKQWILDEEAAKVVRDIFDF